MGAEMRTALDAARKELDQEKSTPGLFKDLEADVAKRAASAQAPATSATAVNNSAASAVDNGFVDMGGMPSEATMSPLRLPPDRRPIIDFWGMKDVNPDEKTSPQTSPIVKAVGPNGRPLPPA